MSKISEEQPLDQLRTLAILGENEAVLQEKFVDEFRNATVIGNRQVSS